jgi:hypothetical protein
MVSGGPADMKAVDSYQFYRWQVKNQKLTAEAAF